MIITLHKLIFSVNTPWLIYCSSTVPRIFVWLTSFKLVLFYAIIDLSALVRHFHYVHIFTSNKETRLTLIQYLQDFNTYKLMCTHSNYSNSLPKGPFQVLIHFPLAVKVPSSVASLSSQQSKQCSVT